MNEVIKTGGAIIGKANATWPFAKLKVDKNKLELNASVIGNLVFNPSDVISIVPYSKFLNSGIRINHNVQNYKTDVIFLTMTNANSLIQNIKQTGFLDNDSNVSTKLSNEIELKQANGGFPFKRWFVVSIFLIWNSLFLYDFLSIKGGGPLIGVGVQSALALVFISCLFILISDEFRKLVLKEYRTVDDVKIFIYFIMVLTGLMMLMFNLF